MEDYIADLENEEWRQIPRFKERCEISNFKRIRKFIYKKLRIIKSYMNKGYEQVSFTIDGKIKVLNVNTLYISAFPPNYDLDCLEGEIWKEFPIQGGNYRISSHGRIRTLGRSTPGKILEPHTDDYGYPRIGLYINKKMKMFHTHRLVALAFLYPPDDLNKNQINHLDGNKNNNHYTNLEWCNSKDNLNHALENGLRKRVQGNANIGSKLNKDQVKEIKQLAKTDIKRKDLATLFNITYGYLKQILNGRHWKSVKVD